MSKTPGTDAKYISIYTRKDSRGFYVPEDIDELTELCIQLEEKLATANETIARQHILLERCKPYIEFAEWVFKVCVVEGCDIDGGDGQNALIDRGFLVETIYDPGTHEGLVDTSIVDSGDTIYFFDKALLKELEAQDE